MRSSLNWAAVVRRTSDPPLSVTRTVPSPRRTTSWRTPAKPPVTATVTSC
ncbi:hypothetical protein [Streptomyces sp. NPDC001381]